MNDGDFSCTCANDGYIDWLMRRADKRPALRRPRSAQPRVRTSSSAGRVHRRDFLKGVAAGAGLLAWQGLPRPARADGPDCGGGEGDPTWDWTFALGSGWFLNRPDWGARPPTQAVTIRYAAPTYVIVHHTATANTTDYSQGAAIALSQWIQNYHIDHNGWIDTGEHFTLSRGGYFMEGRDRSTEIELLACYASHVIGAHVANYNNICLGIENEGTYTSVDPSDDMLWNIITSVTTCCFYNSVPSRNVKGHRDFNDTQCPGDRLYALLPYIRAWVAYFLEGGPYPG